MQLPPHPAPPAILTPLAHARRAYAARPCRPCCSCRLTRLCPPAEVAARVLLPVAHARPPRRCLLRATPFSQSRYPATQLAVPACRTAPSCFLRRRLPTAPPRSPGPRPAPAASAPPWPRPSPGFAPTGTRAR
nr:proline-rich protein 18-like [Aegilops tauschii subsp. strangulata]